MDKKDLKAALEVLVNVSVKYSKTAQYIKYSMKEVEEWEKLPVEEVFYFVFVLDYGCLYVMFACL